MNFRNLMLLGAFGAALTGCFGSDKDDSGDDDGGDGADGAADGADGAGDGADGAGDGADGAGDGADGGSTTGDSVSGFLYLGDNTGAELGTWTIAGTTVDCGGCELAFDGDFTGASGVVSDTQFVVTIDGGYVYTDAGDYWGQASFYSDYSAVVWANYYDVVYEGASYYYYGYVYY